MYPVAPLAIHFQSSLFGGKNFSLYKARRHVMFSVGIWTFLSSMRRQCSLLTESSTALGCWSCCISSYFQWSARGRMWTGDESKHGSQCMIRLFVRLVIHKDAVNDATMLLYHLKWVSVVTARYHWGWEQVLPYVNRDLETKLPSKSFKLTRPRQLDGCINLLHLKQCSINQCTGGP